MLLIGGPQSEIIAEKLHDEGGVLIRILSNTATTSGRNPKLSQGTSRALTQNTPCNIRLPTDVRGVRGIRAERLP